MQIESRAPPIERFSRRFSLFAFNLERYKSSPRLRGGTIYFGREARSGLFFFLMKNCTQTNRVSAVLLVSSERKRKRRNTAIFEGKKNISSPLKARLLSRISLGLIQSARRLQNVARGSTKSIYRTLQLSISSPGHAPLKLPHKSRKWHTILMTSQTAAAFSSGPLRSLFLSLSVFQESINI